jgi:hypothetical protein
MDELTARTHVGTRRMASAKSTTPRRTSSSSGPKRGDPEHEVSPARWAGVAFVIAALVSAIALAFVSPSQPGAAQQPSAIGGETSSVEASPAPSQSVAPARLPTVQPTITNPLPDKETAEREIAVTVELPREPQVPRKDLTLYIMLDGIISSDHKVAKPQTGGAVTVEGVRIEPGVNSLQAVLTSPAGPGPASEPVSITLDTEKMGLSILAPENRYETYDETVRVEIEAEPDAVVEVSNLDMGWDPAAVTVGRTGQESVIARLKVGRNRIRAMSVDQAGQPQTEQITVRRIDGTPHIKIGAPARVKGSSLPAKIAVAVRVTDAAGEPLEGTTVDYSLGGSGRSVVTDADTTNANGRSRWKATIAPTSSISGDQVVVTVTATSPESGETATATHLVDVD